MKYISLLLLLSCLGCHVDINKDLRPGHDHNINRLDRITEIEMGDMYYMYVMRDRVTSQEVMCSTESVCYLTGRKIDSKGNEIK